MLRIPHTLLRTLAIVMILGTATAGCSAMNGVDVGVRVPIGIGSVGANKTIGDGPQSKNPRGPNQPPATQNDPAPEDSEEEGEEDSEDN